MFDKTWICFEKEEFYNKILEFFDVETVLTFVVPPLGLYFL